MSRSSEQVAAKRTFTLDDLAAQTAGVECRKDGGVLDEVVARLRTLLCVKG